MVLTEARRQFVWSTSTLDIALTVWADAYAQDALCLDGQVLPHDNAAFSATVSLLIEGVAVARTTTDIDGFFAFEGLDHGNYDFQLATTTSTIVAGPIPICER